MSKQNKKLKVENKMTNTLFIMVGIPASGKTSMASMIALENDSVMFSSDDIRKRNDLGNSKEDNVKTFELMNKLTKESLKMGKSVVYDATNLSRKKRKNLIKEVKKYVTNIEAVLMDVSIKDALYLNENRDTHVPHEVLVRMYKNLQLPLVSEGYEMISIHSTRTSQTEDLGTKEKYESLLLTAENHDELMGTLALNISEFEDIYNLPQDSKYHTFSVSRHTYNMYTQLVNFLAQVNQMTMDERGYFVYSKEDSMALRWSVLLHDIGKAYCKSFENHRGEEKLYANFIGHENVSAMMAINILLRIGYDEEFVYRVAEYISLHMVAKKYEITYETEDLPKGIKDQLFYVDETDFIALEVFDNDAK